MKFSKIIFCIFIIFLFLTSCEKEIKWIYDTSAVEEKIVVEAMITNELKNQKIYLTASKILPDQNPRVIQGAVVYVSNGIERFPFFENKYKAGEYISERKFSAVLNRNFTISIEYKEKNYTAQAVAVPLVSKMEIEIKKEENGELYYINTSNVNYSESENAMYQITVTPENSSENIPTALLYYYVLGTVDTNQLFPARREQVFFTKGTKLKIRKYSLSPAYAKYIRAVLSETTWNGGLFDTEKGNPPTNMSEGALGFFAVCNVSEKEIIVE